MFEQGEKMNTDCPQNKEKEKHVCVCVCVWLTGLGCRAEEMTAINLFYVYPQHCVLQ